MRSNPSPSLVPLMLGDAAVLAIFTIIGFANHGEIAGTGSRMLITFLSLCIAWAVVSPWMGLYVPDKVRMPYQLWRVLVAAVITAPLAGWLREFALNEVDPPIFILVMAAFTGLMMLIWRAIWAFMIARQVQHG